MKKTNLINDGINTFECVTATSKRTQFLMYLLLAIGAGSTILAIGIGKISTSEQNNKTDELYRKIDQLQQYVMDKELSQKEVTNEQQN